MPGWRGRQRQATWIKDEAEAVAAVLSAQKRRDLPLGARALAAARLATLERGTNRYQDQAAEVDGSGDLSTPVMTIEEAAAEFEVSPSSVKRAKRVIEADQPVLIDALNSGALTASGPPTWSAPTSGAGTCPRASGRWSGRGW